MFAFPANLDSSGSTERSSNVSLPRGLWSGKKSGKKSGDGSEGGSSVGFGLLCGPRLPLRACFRACSFSVPRVLAFLPHLGSCRSAEQTSSNGSLPKGLTSGEKSEDASECSIGCRHGRSCRRGKRKKTRVDVIERVVSHSTLLKGGRDSNHLRSRNLLPKGREPTVDVRVEGSSRSKNRGVDGPQIPSVSLVVRHSHCRVHVDGRRRLLGAVRKWIPVLGPMHFRRGCSTKMQGLHRRNSCGGMSILVEGTLVVWCTNHNC
jgi:hypothetical protein